MFNFQDCFFFLMIELKIILNDSMANKFLGALGLDVLVDKIKMVIGELAKKLSSEDVFAEFDVVDGKIQFGEDPSQICKTPIVKLLNVKNDSGTIIESPGDCIIGFISMSDGQIHFWTTGAYASLCSFNIARSESIYGLEYTGIAEWSEHTDSHIRYDYSTKKIEVYNGNNWVNYEFPTGTNVEEITAAEVTEKFNS